MRLNDLQTYRVCPRKYYFSAVENLSPTRRRPSEILERSFRLGMRGLAASDPRAREWAREKLQAGLRAGIEWEGDTPDELLQVAKDQETWLELLLQLCTYCVLPELKQEYEFVSPADLNSGTITTDQLLIGRKQDGTQVVIDIRLIGRWDPASERRALADRRLLETVACIGDGITTAGRLVYLVKDEVLLRPYFHDFHYRFRSTYLDQFGNKQRLGKGWARIDILQQMGADKWVRLLKQKYPQYLGECVRIMPERRYSDDEIESAIDQLDRTSQDIFTSQLAINKLKMDLDTCYPQYSHSCYVYTPCPYFSICHEGEGTDSPQFITQEKTDE